MQPTALITGASSGIGLELARVFARNKYNLVLVARRAEKLADLAQELSGVNVRVIVQDLALPEAPQAVFDELKADNVQIDVLVNNAGVGDFGFFHERTWQKQVQMLDLNMRALTEMCYLFGGEMVKRKSGKIMNVASTAAFQPGPLMSVYCATKHYVLAFSEGIAEEWKDFGVVVSALCPGATESGFQDAADLGESKLVKNKKLPTSREVAEYGYKALMARKVVAIHGWGNAFLANTVPFMPRSWVRKIARKMLDK